MGNRVIVAGLHLEGRALQWHQEYIGVKGTNAYSGWDEYAGVHFGSHAFDDPIVELRNIRQVRTLQVYLNAFDKLHPKAKITEEQSLSFFISGLSDELQMPIRMFKPKSLAEAYS